MNGATMPLPWLAVTDRLPLFPLSAALFPGLVLPLNIFEERYRAIVRGLLALAEDGPRRFGVIAIKNGQEVAPTGQDGHDPGPAAGLGEDPIDALHRVGCVADAAAIPERADGGFELLATGTIRFRILSVDASGAYLTAEIEEIPEAAGEGAGALAPEVVPDVPHVPEAAGRRARTVPGRRGPARRPDRRVVSGRGGHDPGRPPSSGCSKRPTRRPGCARN